MGALSANAPDAARTLAEVEHAAWVDGSSAGLGDLVELASRLCAAQVGLSPLDPPRGTRRARWADANATEWRSIGGFSSRDVCGLRFAEQFSVDVASMTPELRAELFAEFGAGAGDFAAVVFVLDFLPRTWAGLDALVGEPAGARRQGPVAGLPQAGLDSDAPHIWEALDAFTRAVPALDTLDPILTELVRLRGAGQHHCRLCSSLRSRPALLAGAEESTFTDVLGGGNRGLGPIERAALRFTDAMIWTPAAIPPDVTAMLRAELSEGQRVELVLDITRNALNKVAVALGADAPHVETGVEIYDVDPDGNLLYGLTLD
jgi:alkylhydroperoxidase family enzyme